VNATGGFTALDPPPPPPQAVSKAAAIGSAQTKRLRIAVSSLQVSLDDDRLNLGWFKPVLPSPALITVKDGSPVAGPPKPAKSHPYIQATSDLPEREGAAHE
jgi:hypothetical protein